MRSDWISASAAAWTFGGLTAVLGYAVSPLPTDVTLGSASLVASQHDSQWVLSIGLLFCAAVGMCLGTPVIVFLLRDRSRVLAWNTAVAYLVGSVGMAGQAMLLAFIRALVNDDRGNAASLDAASSDLVLNILLLSWSAGLFAGLLMLAVGLWRAGTTPSWVPAAFVLFVVSQFLALPGGTLVDTLRFVLLAVPIAGASYAAHQQRRELAVPAEPQHDTPAR